jgi:hypothetical protein
MKKVILFMSLSIALFSCSNESKMKSGIKEYFNTNAKDPKSYEFVELKVFDTLTIGAVAKSVIEDIDRNIQSEKDDIIFQKGLMAKYPTLTGSEEKSKIESSEEMIKIYKTDKEAVKKFLNSKEIVLYNASHKYRLKNGFGALDLSNSDFVFDKDFNVVKMATENDPVYDINAGYCYEHYFNKK